MTPGHLVAGLDAALHRHVDLDHLEHARGQVITLNDLALFGLEAVAELLTLLSDMVGDCLQLAGGILGTQPDLQPLITGVLLGHLVEIGLGDLGTGLEAPRSAIGDLTHQHSLDALEGVVLHDAPLIFQVLAHPLQFHLLDLMGAFVLFDAIPGEDLHVDHGARHAGGQTQGGVLHVRCLLAKDGPQQLLLRRELGFTLGGHLAHQDVTVTDLGTDVDDARLVELGQGRLADVGYIGGDLLGPQLGVASQAGQFLDVDGGEAILLHHPLGDEDGVLKVVAVPGHEGDAQILSQGQLTHVGGGTIGQDVAAADLVAHRHQGALIDTGILIGPGVFGQIVDIDARHPWLGLVVIDPHHDARRVHCLDHAAAAGHDGHTRVDGHHPLHPRAHQRLFRPQGRHRLALHVGAHEGAVGVVVLQEGNEGGGDGHNLARRDVHVLDLPRGLHRELVLVPAGDQGVGQPALRVQGGVGLGDDEMTLVDGGEIMDLVGNLTIFHLAIGGLKEAIAVGTGEDRQGVDEADVGPFRGLDGTDPAVMGRVHVAHLEAGALPGQTAGTQGGDPALVRDLGQGVVLVHELRELAGAEELLDRRRYRLGIDQFLRHQTLGLGQG